MSEDAPPPVSTAPAQAAERKVHPLTAAAAQNLHAVLVGFFTILASIVSAILGYYFGHEDRQSMMRLEYDKLRAEHTLEIAKSIAAAEAHMSALGAEGSIGLNAQCFADKTVADLEADAAKLKPFAMPLSGRALDRLGGIERHLKFANIDPNARDLLLLQVDSEKSLQSRQEETLGERVKASNESIKRLVGDTLATLQIYHGDRAEAYGDLVKEFADVNVAAQQLLSEPKCESEAAFDKLQTRIFEWNVKATDFVQTLGIAIKPG